MYEQQEQAIGEAVPAGEAPAVEEPPDGVGTPAQQPRRPLSARQIRAIYEAMRTFRDDDISRTGGKARVICDRCGCHRDAAGSLVYGALRLCNGCATDYELLRASGMEREIVIFAQEPPSVASRPDAVLDS